DSGDRLSQMQRIALTQNHRVAAPSRRAQKAEIVDNIGILSGDFPQAAATCDPDRRGVPRHMAVRHDDRGRDGDAAANEKSAPLALDLHSDDTTPQRYESRRLKNLGMR